MPTKQATTNIEGLQIYILADNRCTVQEDGHTLLDDVSRDAAEAFCAGYLYFYRENYGGSEYSCDVFDTQMKKVGSVSSSRIQPQESGA